MNKHIHEQYLNEIKEVKTHIDFNRYLITKGQQTPVTPVIRTTDNEVMGADIAIWIKGVRNSDGSYVYQHDSFNSKYRGIAKIILDSCANCPTETFKAYTFSDFVDIAKFLSDKERKVIQLVLNKIKQITV